MSASASINTSVVGLPSLSFYNDATYIRVENGNTGAVAYFSKKNLNLQCDSSTSFLLHTDDTVGHYLFADVVRPAAASVKQLLETLQAWIEESDAGREAGPFVSDETTTLAEVKVFYDKAPLIVDEYVTNQCFTTYDAAKNMVGLRLIDQANSVCIRQTKKYASFVNNKTTYAVVSGVLVSSTDYKNVVAKLGCFDDIASMQGSQFGPLLGNGIFFQHRTEGLGLSLVLRSNLTGTQVDVVVDQADWNLDRLDGSGASGLTLDTTQEQTYVFEWSAFNGSAIRAGYLQDGRAIWCHRFVNVRMGCASLPMRWELARLDPGKPISENTAVATSFQGAGSVFVQGRDDDRAATVTVTRGLSSPAVVSVGPTNSPQGLLTVRMAYGYLRASLLPRRLQLLNLDQGVGKWSLLLNATTPFVGASYWTWRDRIQYLPTVASVAGGHAIASGFFAHGITDVVLSDKCPALLSFINGWPDQLTLAIEYVRGVVNVVPTLEWVEIE